MKKLVVITGASSGFGKALALEFNKAGYPLLLIARRVELLKDLENCKLKCPTLLKIFMLCDFLFFF